jgi:NAD(P)-dependent dehydrogenase (short-subunit alcohol dehydrogenase family)
MQREESLMAAMSGRKAVVIGGSRDVGRAIVAAAYAEGADVLAVARRQEPLEQLSRDLPGVGTLAVDARDETAPEQIFAALQLCGGAWPHAAPLHEQDWETFSRSWENDVKYSFLFCKAALLRPLPPGSTVILISSGAGLGGSPISGGYAGAKRMQMFLANYAQKESDRLGLGLRFLALVPMRPMPQTEGGRAAVEGYANYLKISADDFMKRMDAPQTPEDVARAVLDLAKAPRTGEGNVFTVSAAGVSAAP